jgi:hypothetical protein
MLPPTLHFLQGRFVCGITLGNHFLEVAILRLYDLVGGLSMVGELAGTTQLLTGHGFHAPRFLPL